MTKRNSTSKQRPSRNANGIADPVKTAKRSTTPLPPALFPAARDSKEPHRRALHEAIETERTRLSQAHSLLGCLHRALENTDDASTQNQPYYPDIVEIAMDIVSSSVNRLDSLYIRPLVEAI